ncbi:MAG: PKD domain-containing protein [Chloroflexi bacterium]|nr:PKD domain-containing protein [Chloroflexota bacterium]MDA1173365.1 PKD domain-containing protein [Chloroflexota bacterium]
MTLELGNTAASAQVSRSDELVARVESVSFNVKPRPPGVHAVIAIVADTEGRESSAATTVEWTWSDPEHIAVNLLDPAVGIQVEEGETLSFAAEFDAPDFVTPRIAGLDESLKEIAFDILSDIRRYEVVWDFHDGTVERETFDVSKGTSSFFHTFDETGDHLVTVVVTDQLFKMTGTDRLVVEVVEKGGLEPPEPTLEWKVQETTILPSEARGEEGQAGAFWQIVATGSSMHLTSRHVAYGEEVNTVSMEFAFTPPPSVLAIGETYTINVTGTAITTGTVGPGYRWTFTAPYPATGPAITLDPRGGENGRTEFYSFVAKAGKEGDTLQISATVDGLRCEGSTPCRVRWVYELVAAD